MKMWVNNWLVEVPENKVVTRTLPDGRTQKVHVKEVLDEELFWLRLGNIDDGKPDPIDSLCLFSAYIHYEEQIPPELKQWFLDGVHKFIDNEGVETLGGVLGFIGKETEHHAFQKAKYRINLELIGIMHHLIFLSGLRPASAARLAIWRENLADPPTSDTLTTNYARAKRKGKYSDKEHKYLPPDLDHLRIDCKFLESFLFRADLPEPHTSKDLELIKIRLNEMKRMTSGEYFELITRQ